MAGALISGMVSLLSKPGFIPAGLEAEGLKLHIQFLQIQPVLAAVENHFIDDERVADWLTALNAATYDADALLDELNYEKLCAEAENDGLAADGVSPGLLSLCKISSRKENTFQNEIRSILKKVVERMDNIVKSMGDFDFEKGVKEGVDGVDFATGEFEFIEPEEVVVGREKEMHVILSLLFCPVRETTVFSIVGVGGSGKKTLAQSVFSRAKEFLHFDLLLWIDMGEGMPNVANILKCLVDQAIGKDCCISEADMDLLQRRLRQELNGRSYLIVLNNVREFSSWTCLKSLLNHGWGTTIVITHSLEIAHNLPSYFICELDYLNEEDSWKLFCKRAFTTGKTEYPEVHEIGKYFIHVCGGVPLRLNMLGSLMMFKKEPAEWREVLHQLEKGGDFSNKTIIWICYNHLPSNIKKCFAFSSVFPKGHVMDKDIMIKLWIANGLIDSDGSTNPEAKGDLIFKELVMRYFFQDVKRVHRDVFGNNHEYHGRVVFKVLDLVHDLARSVAPRDHPYNSELNQSMKREETIRHVSITGDQTLDIAMAIKAWPNARSILSPVESLGRAIKCDDFPKPNSLRALHVRSSLFRGDLSELKHMKHLRYLDLSGSMIKTLPEATSTLYCMQTLNLSKCLLLCQLPKDMRYMRSLRHLSVDRCPRLKKMPAYLGQLNCLQTLTTYIIGEDAGYRIGEIKGLNLGGLLELYNLRKVKDAAKAKEVDLFAKSGLESLSLCWGGQQYIASKATNDFHVLEALKPHVGLKVLKIQQYGDPEFAVWLANPVYLKNLVELHLSLCTELKTVRSVWHLPSLQVLSLKYMNSLSYIYASSSLPGEGSEGSSKLFPALKRLVLIGMKSLKEWQEGEVAHEIYGCPLLAEIPKCSSSLIDLELDECPKITSISSNRRLKTLYISCTTWTSLPNGWKQLTKLNSLRITECYSLTNLPDEMAALTSLNTLVINECPRLKLWSTQHSALDAMLSRLELLKVSNCADVKNFSGKGISRYYNPSSSS
ncbi:hypothetical protein LUZ60_008391 [Juncus effusus]|nr:hypothetical protein LUZ60_008391 [Juncus effusus]